MAGAEKEPTEALPIPIPGPQSGCPAWPWLYRTSAKPSASTRRSLVNAGMAPTQARAEHRRAQLFLELPVDETFPESSSQQSPSC